MPITHTFVSAKSDGGDATLVRPSDWNAAHTFNGKAFGAGTSFPGSPAVDDQFYRTDRNLAYYYDGTRWLSVTLYSWQTTVRYAGPHGSNITATTTAYERVSIPPLMGNSDIYVLEFISNLHLNSGTALSGSHKWVATLGKRDSANALTNVGTINIDSGSDNIWRRDTTTVNTLLGTAYYTLEVTWTKTGTPGDLQSNDAITYRLVG